MAKLVVLYKRPSDVAAFERYYHLTHAPLVKKIPGLKRFEVSQAPIISPTGAAYYFAAIMEYESMEALDRGMKSPEGQAAAADVANFGQAGADVLIVDTKSI